MLRETNVGFVRVNSVADGSIIEIGDAKKLDSRVNIIAVQEEGGTQNHESYSITNYPLFRLNFPSLPSSMVFKKKTIHHNNNINVRTIDVTGVSAAATIQLGSVKSIRAEARIKHIRILRNEQMNETNI
ncbi:spore germination protein GerPE [Paraliobacillus ryukyuensis]|uniref:spore germination protein GerPE n=1 Tax=Paraliobacillus ryukyuensis TaxID=200904 RepID=UPI0009A624FE|nr:spore germination protein GerPE [Paraliobacillus ryukyuensis]